MNELGIAIWDLRLGWIGIGDMDLDWNSGLGLGTGIRDWDVG